MIDPCKHCAGAGSYDDLSLGPCPECKGTGMAPSLLRDSEIENPTISPLAGDWKDNLKPGDKVIIHSDAHYLATVVRTTGKQVVVSRGHGDIRFWKTTGRRVGESTDHYVNFYTSELLPVTPANLALVEANKRRIQHIKLANDVSNLADAIRWQRVDDERLHAAFTLMTDILESLKRSN